MGSRKACVKAQGWLLKGLPLYQAPSEERPPDQEGQVPGAMSSGRCKIFTEEMGRKYLPSGERVGVGGKEEGRISGFLA